MSTLIFPLLSWVFHVSSVVLLCPHGGAAARVGSHGVRSDVSGPEDSAGGSPAEPQVSAAGVSGCVSGQDTRLTCLWSVLVTLWGCVEMAPTTVE